MLPKDTVQRALISVWARFFVPFFQENKLKLNHGVLKATQGDTGHAEIDMITKVYAHILDEDRKINAQKFESAFYANPDLRNVKLPQEPKQPQAQTLDLAALIEQLQNSPELASALAALIQGQKQSERSRHSQSASLLAHERSRSH